MVSYIARVASKKDRTSAAPVIGRGNTDASRTTSLVKAAAKASSVGRLMISNQLCPGGRFRSDRRNDVGCGKRSCCAIAKSALAISNKPATILGARQFMSSSFVTFGRDLTRCVGCLSTTPAEWTSIIARAFAAHEAVMLLRYARRRCATRICERESENGTE